MEITMFLSSFGLQKISGPRHFDIVTLTNHSLDALIVSDEFLEKETYAAKNKL